MDIRLFNSDCYDFLAKIPDGSIDLALLDPPYGISRPDMYNVKAKDDSGKKTPNGFGEWDFQPINESKLVKEIYRVLKPGGTFICFYDQEKIWFLKTIAGISGFKHLRKIYWHKTNPAPHHAKTTYLLGTEEAIVCHKPIENGNYTFNSSMHKGYFCYPIAKSKFHTTPKNVDLLAELISIHTNAGDTVLDCYSGSGSTAVAAAKTGRNFVGCELDKNFYKCSLDRIEKDTKKMPDVNIRKGNLGSQKHIRIKTNKDCA